MRNRPAMERLSWFLQASMELTVSIGTEDVLASVVDEA